MVTATARPSGQRQELKPFVHHSEDPEVVGLCSRCLRWRIYGLPCPVCGEEVGYQWRLEKEVDYRLVEVVMAMQDHRPQGSSGTLYTLEAELKEAMSPKWRLNANMNVLLRKVNTLRGIAARYGLMTGDHAAGWEDVVVDLGGVQWNARKRGADFKLVSPVETGTKITEIGSDALGLQTNDEKPPLYVSDKTPEGTSPALAPRKKSRRSENPVGTSRRVARAEPLGK